MSKRILLLLAVIATGLSVSGCEMVINLFPDQPADDSDRHIVWRDGFEQYPSGTFPTEHWTRSGNADAPENHVDSSAAASGDQSLRLTGQFTGCWSSSAYRPLLTSPPFTVEFKVFLSGKGGSGCHKSLGFFRLNTGPNWKDSGRKILAFALNGEMRTWVNGCCGDGVPIGDYQTEQWISVKIQYDVTSAGVVEAAYWIDDQMKRQVSIQSDQWYVDHRHAGSFDERDISYLALGSGDSQVWFDDIRVSKPQ